MNFDYDQLDADIRETVLKSTGAIRAELRHTVEGILKIGRELIPVKDSLPHGCWLPWLAAEFAWSDETARRYMNVAIAFPQIPTGLEFQAKALYLLAEPSTPEEARVEALQIAEAGYTVTLAVAERITKRAIAAGIEAGLEVIQTSGYVSVGEDSVKFDEPFEAAVTERLGESIHREATHIVTSVQKSIDKAQRITPLSKACPSNVELKGNVVTITATLTPEELELFKQANARGGQWLTTLQNEV